jgi:hypothetical protein
MSVRRYRPTVTDVQATAYCGDHPDGEFVQLDDYDALLAAARKVTCANCANEHWGVPRGPCPDCADLRKLLENAP